VLEPETTDGLKRWRVAKDGKRRSRYPEHGAGVVDGRTTAPAEDARHILQLAAVIGRSFSWRVLEAVCGAPQELKRQLSTLQQRDLIYELAGVPELEYSFRHALTQEAAYNSILLKHRRQFHGWVGEAMERLYSDHLEEQAAVLAHHFAEAADRERALRYFTLAGDAAARLHAHVEAGDHYARALEIAARNGAPNDTLVYLYSRRGRTLEMRGRYQDALANYRELEALARERNDLRLELAALIPQATVHSTFTVEFDPHQGRALSDRALALSRRLGDPRAEAKSY
jgi:predicted ATPase